MDLDVWKFVAQAVISVAGAFLAAYLAGRRFRTEKWWERKVAAYAELIEALHQMKWQPSEHMEAEFENRRMPEKEAEEGWSQFKLARRNVWRIADASSFLVSRKVLEAVQEMERGLGRQRTRFFELDAGDADKRGVGHG